MRDAPLNTLYTDSGSVQSPVTPAASDGTSWIKLTVLARAEEGGSCHNLDFSACHPSLPQYRVCALSLGGLEGCSESWVWLQFPVVFSVPHVPVLWAPFDRLIFSPLVYSDLTVMLVFATDLYNPCLSCLFISVCTAFPPCVCSAPSCGAWANILVFAGKTLFWVVGVFIPCLFPAIIAFLCSDCAGFSSSCHAHLACTPCMFIWELYSFTQSQKVNADSSLWSGK